MGSRPSQGEFNMTRRVPYSVLGVLLLSSVTGAATDDSVTLGGTVASQCSIDATATSGSLTKLDGQDIAFQAVSVADAGTAPASGAFLTASGDNYTWDSAASA